MPEIYTEAEAADYLRTAIETLVNLRRRKQINYIPLGKEARYTSQHLIDFLKRKEKGALCGESHTSSSYVMQPVALNHHAGTSAIMTENEVNASLLGVKLARKTMKPTLRSQPSYSNGKGQQHGSRIN